MRTMILLFALMCPAISQDVFKCVAPDGKVTFQEIACPASEREHQVTIRNTESRPPSVPGMDPSIRPTQSADQRLLATAQRERRLKELEQTVSDIENTIANRNAIMANEMAEIRSRKAYARNNLAGATWQQSLSMEMQAVATKYKAMNDADLERLKVLRVDLEATRRLAGK